jgi:hypothetical protein
MSKIFLMTVDISVGVFPVNAIACNLVYSSFGVEQFLFAIKKFRSEGRHLY